MTGSTNARYLESNGAQKRHEQIATSSVRICEQYLGQLQNIAAVLAAALRNPPVTETERGEHLRILRATLELAEKYASDTEADYTLLARLAHDARGLPSFELSASEAAELLAKRAADMARPKKAATRPAPGGSKHHPQAIHA